MKQQVKKMVMLAVFSLAIGIGYSQNNIHSIAPWSSEKGYWVIEGNINDLLNHTIRFYNTQNMLVHTEQLSGIKLDINKKKIKMKLKKALETAVNLYAQHQEPAAIRDYVVKILK